MPDETDVVILEDLLRLGTALDPIARAAGHAILDVVRDGDLGIEKKDDDSPVTKADAAAEEVILHGLEDLTPGVPIVAEESVSAGRTPTVDGDPFWLVDPLDGTKEFIKGTGEYTVNIALIVNHRPALGVVHAPASGVSYRTAAPDVAFKVAADGTESLLRGRPDTARARIAAVSRSHRDPRTADWLSAHKIDDLCVCGSSIKFCVVAEGAADVYPRLGRTMEWDVAAGHAVLNAAGGRVETLDGKPFTYGKPDFENPDFVAWGAGEA